MEQHGIFEDVIDKFTPTVNLEIRYGSKLVKGGNIMKLEDVQLPPLVSYDADNTRLYTLAMVDPDNLSRDKPTLREFRHWLVSNIPGSKISAGTQLSSYMGSAPQPDTGLHRYVFLLFQQDSLVSDPPMNDEGLNRGHFHIAQWAKAHRMHPVAGDLYQAEKKSTSA